MKPLKCLLLLFVVVSALSSAVGGISPVLLIDKVPQNCFLTDAAKVTPVALEENNLKINVTYEGSR